MRNNRGLKTLLPEMQIKKVFSSMNFRNPKIPACYKFLLLQMGMMSELITVHPGVKEEPQEQSWPMPAFRKRPSQDPTFFEPPTKYYAPPTPMTAFLPQQYSYTPLPPVHQNVYIDTPEMREYVPPTPMNYVDQNDYNLPSVSKPEVISVESPQEYENPNFQTKIDKSEEADPLVPLPKSVLMHLINLCHQGPQRSSEPVPSDSYQTKPSQVTCVCRCKCGATSSVEEIDEDVFSFTTEKTDERSITTDLEINIDQEREPKKLSITWTSQLFREIDNVVTTADKNTSTALDLVPVGSVVDFPPDIDAWKLFRLEELLSANEILAPPRRTSGPVVSFADAGIAADMV